MRETLLSGWNVMRLLRLAMGILMAFQFIQTNDKLVGFVGLVLLFQALFNKGCCGSAACAGKSRNNLKQQAEEINFEEVK